VKKNSFLSSREFWCRCLQGRDAHWRRCSQVFLFSMALFFTATGGFAQYQLLAKLEPDTTYAGGTTVYSLTVQLSGNGSVPAPKLPDFDPSWGLSMPQSVGTRSTIINGAATMSFRYAISASKEGTFNIGPSTIEAGGRVFKSNAVTLKVTKMPTAANVPAQLQGLVAPPEIPNDPALAQKLAGAIFVLPVVTNPNPFNGEQIRISFHLCMDDRALANAGLTDARAVTNIEAPDMTQFIKEEIFPFPREIKRREQVIGGRSYNVAPLYEVAISSTKTGKVQIGPFKIGLQFGSRSSKSRFGGDPFDDDFYANFPGFSGLDPLALGLGGGRVEVIAQSRPVDIDVKPLPTEGRPPGFSGAVGDFKLAATPDRDKAIANEDVVKLTLTIEGKGDASAIKPPALPNLPGFTTLGDPKTSNQGRKENDEYITTKKIDYILRPTQPGKQEIPPIAMSVFNPKTQLYESLQSNPVQVDVAKGTQPAPVMQAPATAPASPENPPAAQPVAGAPPPETDLRYIHTAAFSIIEPGVLTGEGPLFFTVLALPPAMLLAGYLWGRRRQVAVGDVQRRRRRAGEMARKHLRHAEKSLNSPDRTNFFAELALSIRTYFGDRFGVEPAGLTIHQIASELEAVGASAESITLAERLLEQCDAARFSPVQPPADVARDAYDEAIELLNRAEKER
jgi:hypothetical protein